MAERFEAGAAVFSVEASPDGGGGGPGGAARFGRLEGVEDQAAEAVAGVLAIAELLAEAVGFNEKGSTAGETAAGESGEAFFDIGGELGAGGEVEGELGAGIEFVDVLAAGPAGADEAEAEAGFGDFQLFVYFEHAISAW